MELIKSLEVLGIDSAISWQWIMDYDVRCRAYHNTSHIQQMLNFLLPSDATKEMIASIWLHDIVYFPGRPDNEERSAEQAKVDLEGLDIDIDLVVKTILGSKHHEPGSDFQNTFNDLDLSILGSATVDYRRYSKAIRLEYSYIQDNIYIPGRIKALKSFLERDRIFLTAPYQYLECVAIINLQQEIDELENSLRSL